jgi:flagellar protein FlbD
VVILTRLNGTAVALNADLIERADATPDTVLTLVDGTKYLVRESLDEVIDLIREFRASILARAQAIECVQSSSGPLLRVLPETGED